ncbi:Ig-like domain-containing protein [Lutispora sp.]|uniref:Ig-like domain-containing protein n=1 Tax=Lutispora sp. TaxID=2828727 RepID=UPI000EDCA3DF|nr:Ig-like domain-containing protein [Lutispora sp.]MEA4963563.1 Ig-like domain-containing protein [Lutispora sp.]HCJ58159.1 hypothetical protein [Clostridiaceae bacterium]
MKKIKLTALLMAVILISGSILPSAVFADTIGKEAKACEALGILVGPDETQGVTSSYLASTPTRLQALIIFLRIKGLDEDAFKYDGDNNFIDAKDLQWVVGRNYLAYAKDNPELGWVGGTDGKFSPNKFIDAKAFYKVMLETLGYKQDLDFTYGDTLKFAETIDLITSASSIEKQTGFTVNDVAKAIYGTLNTKPKGETKKLITIMTEKGIIDEAKAVAAGFKIDITPVKVLSFDRISNNKLVLELEQEIPVSKDDISIVSETGDRQITINDASVIGKKVYITTADVAPFTAYKLSVDMDKPVNGMAIKGYNIKYVALPKDTEKPKATVEIISNTVIRLSFDEEVQISDAEDVSNYTIKNDLYIYNAELDPAGKVVTLTTAPQREGYKYWLTAQNVRDISGNTMEYLEKTFTGMPKDIIKPSVYTIKTDSNKSILVKFTEPVNRITAERIENYIIEGNALTIEEAVLDETENEVTLTTSTQNPGSSYKITIRNIADLADNVMYDITRSFTGASSDSSKLTTSVVAFSGNELEITFNKRLDKASAENIENYIIDNDLQITKAILDGSGKTVTLITEDQSNKKYKLEISNLQDINGNAIGYYTAYFIGKPSNTTPLSYSVKSGKGAVIITFNKRVDKETAENVFNYELDSSLGYAAKATLDSDATGAVVTLLTKTQENGKIYSITVKNVTDYSGKTISTDDKVAKKSFIGFGSSDLGGLNLHAINAYDVSTIDIFFDKELAEDELKDLEVTILSEDGRRYAVPTGLKYQKYFSADKSTVRAQFKTDSSTKPEIFESGKIYEVRVSNINRLYESSDGNIKAFSGTNQANEAPYITDAYAMNSTAVEVTFSKPVTGISPSQFTISGVRIADASVKYNEITTSVTLYLSSSTPLKDDVNYKLTPRSGIKDAAGYSSIVTSGNLSYKEFAGNSSSNEAPVVQNVVALDKYTVTVDFSEPIVLPGSSGFSIRRTPSGGSSIVVSGTILSDDKKTATIYLNSSNGALSTDYSYELSLNTSIKDLQGLAISSDYRKVEFEGSDVDLSDFGIMAYSVGSDNKTITFITNRPIKNTSISMDCFEITGAYYSKSSSDSVEVYGRMIKIKLRNTLRSNDTVSIKLTNTGRSTIKDLNNQNLNMDEIELSTN